jgi:hypothetical protein
VHAVCLAEAICAVEYLLPYDSMLLPQRIRRQNLDANRAGNVTVMRRRLGGPRVSGAVASVAGVPATRTLDELQLERLHLLNVNEAMAGMGVPGGAALALLAIAEGIEVDMALDHCSGLP